MKAEREATESQAESNSERTVSGLTYENTSGLLQGKPTTFTETDTSQDEVIKDADKLLEELSEEKMQNQERQQKSHALESGTETLSSRAESSRHMHLYSAMPAWSDIM